MDIDRNGPVSASSDLDSVVCPECGSEFQPHVTRCIDCGAATVAPGGAVARAPEAPAEPAAETAEVEEVPVRT
ncbi:MAG TPA: hypothetical protein VIE43_22245, partial [Thermoanaerobaculia bacterium]|nr:hypothetical protein [Thermoanaerobaculia bacterium]